jgi:alkaline phosphatase D
MDRRTFLVGATASAAAVALPVRALAAAAPNPALLPFVHGVASGDPLADRVVLWTRVTGRTAAVPVRWLVATDPQLRQVVRSGQATASSQRDHTVKVDVDGLRPGSTYWYAFEALGRRSMIGRTRTAPTASQRLRFAVVTCAKYENGFFNAYARVAEADVDAVLHLGDYIYEGATDSDVLPGRVPDPTTEIRTLAEYRRRYAQYRLDPDLQRMHQQHPMVATWDDHESSNDSWRDGAGNHDVVADGSWSVRKAASQRVYDEWLPIRLPVPGNPSRVYRQLPYGGLVDLIVLDTRLEGRSQQVVGLNGDEVVIDPAVSDPARQMYSATQRAFIERSLSQSKASWKVVLNQVLISQFRAVGLPKPVMDALSSLGQSGLPTQGVALAADIWDGYTAERDRLLGFLRTAGIDDVVVLTGDIHVSLANDLTEDPFDILKPSVAVELVTPSVTSTNFDESLGVPPRTTSLGIEAAIRTQNPSTRYVELDSNGYVLLDVTPERVQGEWWFIDSLTTRSTGQRLDATWQSVRGANTLSAGGPATVARSSRPAAAPTPAVVPVSTAGPARPRPAGGTLPSTGGGASVLAALTILGAAVLRRRTRPSED